MKVSPAVPLAAMGFLVAAQAAQAPATAPCEEIVERVRAAPSKDAWSVLAEGDRPYIETAAGGQRKALFGDAGTDEVISRFVASFNPSDELREAWIDWIGKGYWELYSLAGSNLHMVSVVGGSASCASFMLFQAAPGGQARLLPELPRKSDKDGENAICYKHGSDAHLARVGGVPSFVETFRHGEDGFWVRVVPLRDARWAPACAAGMEYGTEYVPSRVFLPEDGALTVGALRQAAAQIVEKRDAVAEARDFSFGPSPTGSLKEQLEGLMQLAGTLGHQPFPAFGREKELQAGEEDLDSSEFFPVVVDGRAYLLALGMGQLGCCYEVGPLLILYTTRNGTLVPAGSAIVERHRGKLLSASAEPSR